MVEVRRKKMIKVLKEGQNRYIAICPNCESIMEFDETDIRYGQIECPYIHILCPVCGKALPAYSFVEIKND